MAAEALTPEEEAFRAMLQQPPELHAWAEQARQGWERTPTGKAAVARCYRTIGGFRGDWRCSHDPKGCSTCLRRVQRKGAA